jgi:hypothetical protein
VGVVLWTAATEAARGTHSAGREVIGALRGDGAGQRKREEGGGDLHDDCRVVGVVGVEDDRFR